MAGMSSTSRICRKKRKRQSFFFSAIRRTPPPALSPGRNWKKSARFAQRTIFRILSDEIHGDIVFDGRKHIPIASLSPELAQRTITCTSPSKTFSVAGLVASVIIIPNEELRRRFEAVKERNCINTNILGLVAMQAAYTHGDDYADQVTAYLQENRDFALRFLRERVPAINPIAPEATFLLWMDCGGLGIASENLESFFTGAGLRLSGGTAYQEPTGQFVRLNFGCTRATLKAGLERLERAVLARK